MCRIEASGALRTEYAALGRNTNCTKCRYESWLRFLQCILAIHRSCAEIDLCILRPRRMIISGSLPRVLLCTNMILHSIEDICVTQKCGDCDLSWSGSFYAFDYLCQD